MDTTQTELLNQAISQYIKGKDYSKAAEIVIKKTLMKKDVANDYYILGKLYYNLHEWNKADSVFSINIYMDPGNIKGYIWKAWSQVNLDPDSKEGLAKPTFEMLIEKAKPDSVKNSKELTAAYSYLSYYYFLQYIKIHCSNFRGWGIFKKLCHIVQPIIIFADLIIRIAQGTVEVII